MGFFNTPGSKKKKKKNHLGLQRDAPAPQLMGFLLAPLCQPKVGRSPPCLPQWWLRTQQRTCLPIFQCSDLSSVRPGEATISRRSHSPGDLIRAIQTSSFPQPSPSFLSPAKLSLDREAYLLFQTLNTELQARKHRRSPDSGRTSQRSLPSPSRLSSGPDPVTLWALGGLSPVWGFLSILGLSSQAQWGL